MTEEKIAVVTGANKGLGFEICRQLAKKGIKVVLTARDEEKGQLAMNTLKKEGLNTSFYKLDVADKNSIKNFSNFMQYEYGKIDILVNNAGIFIDNDKNSLNVDIDVLVKTMNTNFYGPFYLSQTLMPLLKKSEDARIINMSSGLGALERAKPGYPSYSISKTALNGLTTKLAADLINTNVKVNSMCPGWVRTDMGGANASRSIEEGADTAVWLATDPNIPSGKFFRDRKVIGW